MYILHTHVHTGSSSEKVLQYVLVRMYVDVCMYSVYSSYSRVEGTVKYALHLYTYTYMCTIQISEYEHTYVVMYVQQICRQTDKLENR